MSEHAISKSNPTVVGQLSVMMFLQFFVWGAWYVTLGSYMGALGLGDSIGHAYTVGPIAAVISPFFLGMIADRFFATQRVLAVMHFIGGLALMAAPSLAASAAQADIDHPLAPGAEKPFLNMNHVPYLAALFAHMVCYMPTLGLTNSISFAHIRNPEKEFPVIRVLGTIGWIVAGVFVSKVLGADKTETSFYVAGAAGVALGLFSMTLPHTPPPLAGKKVKASEVLGLDALRLLKDPSFVVFVFASLLICVPLAGYYSKAQTFVEHAGFKEPAFRMTFGQMSEIVFMLLMPMFFARLGVKKMLAIGMLAWAARYGLFASASSDGVKWMILAGILLHGICYDFFFVAGFIYVDKKAPPEIRAQAQGFLVLITQGLGLGIGAQVFQKLFETNLPSNSKALVAQGEALRAQSEALEKASGSANADAMKLWDDSTGVMLQSADWENIWLVPAVASAVILVAFFLLFRDDKPKA
jgi:nucleoside transporter